MEIEIIDEPIRFTLYERTPAESVAPFVPCPVGGVAVA